jgi:hypothetical protein
MKGGIPVARNRLVTPEGMTEREWYDFFLRVNGLFDGGSGGIPVADGDYGDIVVSSGGTVWSFDPTVVSAYIRTLLNDPDAATARNTLGIDASTTPYTPADLADWGGVDPGEVDDALDYLAAGSAFGTPTYIAAGQTRVIRAATQMLFCIAPTIDGVLTIDGTYCEVD